MSPSSYPRVGDFSWKMGLHPSKLTWNLKSPLWKGKSCSIIFQTSIFWTWTLEIVLAEDRCIMMHWWHDDVMKYSNQYSKKSQKSKYIYIIFIYLFTYIHVYIYISKYNLYLYVFIRLPSFDFTGLPPTLSDGWLCAFQWSEKMVSFRELLLVSLLSSFDSWKTVFFVDGKKILRAKSC